MNLSRDMALVLGFAVCAVLAIFVTYVAYYSHAQSTKCAGRDCAKVVAPNFETSLSVQEL